MTSVMLLTTAQLLISLKHQLVFVPAVMNNVMSVIALLFVLNVLEIVFSGTTCVSMDVQLKMLSTDQEIPVKAVNVDVLLAQMLILVTPVLQEPSYTILNVFHPAHQDTSETLPPTFVIHVTSLDVMFVPQLEFVILAKKEISTLLIEFPQPLTVSSILKQKIAQKLTSPMKLPRLVNHVPTSRTVLDVQELVLTSVPIVSVSTKRTKMESVNQNVTLLIGSMITTMELSQLLKKSAKIVLATVLLVPTLKLVVLVTQTISCSTLTPQKPIVDQIAQLSTSLIPREALFSQPTTRHQSMMFPSVLPVKMPTVLIALVSPKDSVIAVPENMFFKDLLKETSANSSVTMDSMLTNLEFVDHVKLDVDFVTMVLFVPNVTLH